MTDHGYIRRSYIQKAVEGRFWPEDKPCPPYIRPGSILDPTRKVDPEIWPTPKAAPWAEPAKEQLDRPPLKRRSLPPPMTRFPTDEELDQMWRANRGT